MTRSRFGPCVHSQFPRAASPKLILRQHSLDRFPHHFFGTALQQRFNGHFLQPTRIAAVSPINLLVNLIACKTNLLGVKDDNVVAAIGIGCELRLVLADQQTRNPRGKAPKHLPFCVYSKPVLPFRQFFRLTTFWNIRPHQLDHTFPFIKKQTLTLR